MTGHREFERLDIDKRVNSEKLESQILKLRKMCFLKDLHLGILRKVDSLTEMLISWNEGDEDIFEILDVIIEEQDILIEGLKRESSETQRTAENNVSDISQEMDGIVELLKSLVQEKDLESESLRTEIKRKSEELKVSENKSFYNIIEQLLNSKQNTGM